MKNFEHRLLDAQETIQKEFNLSNRMLLPRIKKICLNTSLANFSGDLKKINAAAEELSIICQQKSVITYAKKSNAAFNLREGYAVGCKVTLRKSKMSSFFDRLVIVALPRVRDFKGLNTSSISNSGNFSLGLKEHIVFPELDYDKIESIKGMDINIDINSHSRDISKRFLELMGIPFYN